MQETQLRLQKLRINILQYSVPIHLDHFEILLINEITNTIMQEYDAYPKGIVHYKRNKDVQGILNND